MVATAALLALPATGLQAEMVLGPPNPNFDGGGLDWFSGASGDSFVNFSEDGGYIENTGRVNLGATAATGNADFRSQEFSLGEAAQGEQPVTIEFFIKFTEAVASGDEILVQLRFWEGPNEENHQGEENIGIHAGTPGIDTQLVGEWQQFRMEDITVPANANYSDIRTSLNIWTDWSSGEAQFDAFSVTTPLPDLETPVALRFFRAHEVEFFAQSGKRYRIESTTEHLGTAAPEEWEWTVESEIITGNDQFVRRMYSNRQEDGRKFRVRTD